VQGRGMAVTSTWHGQKLTARRGMMVPRPVKRQPSRSLHTSSGIRSATEFGRIAKTAAENTANGKIIFSDHRAVR
jgi:hypothetical protein